MLITELMQALSVMLENVGDIEVAVGNSRDNVINRVFAICQYDIACKDRNNKIIVPYLQDKDFILILGSFPHENK